MTGEEWGGGVAGVSDGEIAVVGTVGDVAEDMVEVAV